VNASPTSTVSGARARALLIVGAALAATGCAAPGALPDPIAPADGGEVHVEPLKAPSIDPGGGWLVSRGGVGLDHEHVLAFSDEDRWLDNFAGGLVALDCDLDGDLDLLFPGSDGPDRLYLNDGTGSFVLASGALPGGPDGVSVGAATADFDGDGDPDALVLNQHTDNLVLINDGACHFEDRAADLGLLDSGRSVHATWADLDLDGRLDLYLTNAVDPAPDDGAGASPQPQPDRLWLQRPDGTFEEFTDRLPPDNGNALGMVTAFLDEDGDGDLDALQVNDRGVLYRSNRLYRNDGPDADGVPRFVDVSAERGFDLVMNGMSLAIGDVDLDGDQDVLVTGNYETVMTASEVGYLDSGLALGFDSYDPDVVSWAGLLLDVDADGREDAYYVQSNIYPYGFNDVQTYARAPRLAMNRTAEGAGFEEVALTGGAATASLTRSALAADLDGDGFLDLVNGNVDSAPTVLFGNPDGAGGALVVALEGTVSNREGRGAVVQVEVAGGTLVRLLGAVDPFASGGPPVAHFGLGEAAEADEVTVIWPSGRVQRVGPVPAGSRVRLVEPPD